MYWVKTGENSFEVLDGQQRTLSVMQFLSHKLQITINGKTYYNDSLPDDMYNRLLSCKCWWRKINGARIKKFCLYRSLSFRC